MRFTKYVVVYIRLMHGHRRVNMHIGSMSAYLHEGLQARGQIWSVGSICLVTRTYINFLLGVFVNDVIHNAEGAREGRCRCTRVPLWVHARADMASREWAYAFVSTNILRG